MGRYYSGDIEGKFWFGVQSSTDAENFGASASEPNYVEFYFDKENLPDIKEGIALCKRELTGYKKALDKFFKDNNGYNDEMIIQAGICKDTDEVRQKLEQYARLRLGEQILACVEKNGNCNFECEL